MDKDNYQPQYRAEFHTPDNVIVELKSDLPMLIEKDIRALCPGIKTLRFDDTSTPGTVHIWHEHEYLGQIVECQLPREASIKSQVANRKTVARAA